jgi:hypothetical protein
MTGLAAARSAVAVDATWTGAVDNDFYTNGNWDTNAAPMGGDNALILDPTKPANINFTGTRELGSFHLGTDGATGGNVDFSAGTLVVHADFNRGHIGDQGAADSKFVMRGSATMLYDEPLSGAGGGLGSAGGDQDLEIGAQTGATGNVGVLEMHDNAVLRISDDLKIGAESNGNGEVLIDGNAQLTVGSGISVSEANPSKGRFTAAGNALVVSGNSAGAGNTADGLTNEGYFTLSVNNDSTADVVIKDSAKVYARTLQMRNGVTNMAIQNNGEFHVFDAFAHPAPNLGVATVMGDPFGSQRASHVAQNANSVFNLVINGNGKMSVDSALDAGTSSTFQGLSLSGGDNRGSTTFAGGATNIELRDNASFVIQQNLYMTAASSPLETGASSTLEIVGPDVEAKVNGNLYMSFDPIVSLAQNADPSTILAVITGSTHSTLEVGGLAHLEFGNLAVELEGYSPVGGETYTLLTAGSIVGTSFLNVDLSAAPLAAGLSWNLSVGAKSVVLKVDGSVGQAGDFDGDGDVDGRDFLVWQRGGSPSPLSEGDLTAWMNNFGESASGAAGAVPEPTAFGMLCVAALIGLGRARCGAQRRT